MFKPAVCATILASAKCCRYRVVLVGVGIFFKLKGIGLFSILCGYQFKPNVMLLYFFFFLMV